jgi:uncharacterized membrane protein YvlD (DUF360 family)
MIASAYKNMYKSFNAFCRDKFGVVIWFVVNAGSWGVIASILPGLTLQRGVESTLLVVLINTFMFLILVPFMGHFVADCGLALPGYIFLAIFSVTMHAALLQFVGSQINNLFQFDSFNSTLMAAFLMGLTALILSAAFAVHDEQSKGESVS